jgi:hypothetical protein
MSLSDVDLGPDALGPGYDALIAVLLQPAGQRLAITYRHREMVRRCAGAPRVAAHKLSKESRNRMVLNKRLADKAPGTASGAS